MIINPQTDIGKRVHAYLLDNPMSGRHFSVLVGVSAPTISKLLKGDLQMSMEVHLKLEKFLKNQEKGI